MAAFSRTAAPNSPRRVLDPNLPAPFTDVNMIVLIAHRHLGGHVHHVIVGLLLWITYGVSISAWPLVVANTLTAVQSLAILGLKFRLERKEPLCFPGHGLPGVRRLDPN
jgi:hypothetical protein